MQIIRLPRWGLDYGGAEYFGRRHALQIGPLWFLWGQMTDEEIEMWDRTQRQRPPPSRADAQGLIE